MKKAKHLAVGLSFCALAHCANAAFIYDTAEGKLSVSFPAERIARIRFSPDGSFRGNSTGVTVLEGEIEAVKNETDGEILLSTPALTVAIAKETSAVSFRSPDGATLLSEAGAGAGVDDGRNKLRPARTAERIALKRARYSGAPAKRVMTANGEADEVGEAAHEDAGSAWRFMNYFNWSDDEALYGLGCNMEPYMNLRGKRICLAQHNLKECVPVLASTKGYLLLMDAGSGMVVDMGTDGFWRVEAAQELDYYFAFGGTPAGATALYRELTGRVPMLPKWAFGYVQSKERYQTAEELLGIVDEYRRRSIPLDCIVQDWQYWPKGWGNMTLDPERYAMGAQALSDALHERHARIMVSIWPTSSDCAQADDFKARGWNLPGRSAYDAFRPEARDLYWNYADKTFFSNGFDAWWCDSSEPVDVDWHGNACAADDHARRYMLCLKGLGDACGEERLNLYSFCHSRGIYEHQRAASDAKRVVNLTRSSWAGQQRFSTIVWNGDTSASWESFRQQLPQGLNFMATGCPWWTYDIGGFFVRDANERGKKDWFRRGKFPRGVEDPAYREYYARMFQLGAFLPMFRSHGSETPREVWRFGESGEEIYDALKASIELRYRLMPYIYSSAAAVTLENASLVRPLAFDFPSDKAAWDVGDEFMFGPSLLVAAVVSPGAKVREVYLPAGTGWYDIRTGERYAGGSRVTVKAALSDGLPVFARAGAIIPMGPVEQYTGEKPDAEWTVRVYPGANGRFTVYEDSGDGYAYERGERATWTLVWDDAKGELVRGEPSGGFPGFVRNRRLNIETIKRASPIL